LVRRLGRWVQGVWIVVFVGLFDEEIDVGGGIEPRDVEDIKLLLSRRSITPNNLRDG
jgi:hypothetical protein